LAQDDFLCADDTLSHHWNLYWPAPYFGTRSNKAVLPTEIKIPSPQALVEAEIDDSKWTQSRHNQLTLSGQEKGSNNLPLTELAEKN
jgi:hypothetical protein